MSLSQWGLVAGVKGIINDAEKDGKIAGLVEQANHLLSSFFPGDEKVLRQMIVCKVLMPFVRIFLKEDKEALEAAKIAL